MFSLTKLSRAEMYLHVKTLLLRGKNRYSTLNFSAQVKQKSHFLT